MGTLDRLGVARRGPTCLQSMDTPSSLMLSPRPLLEARSSACGFSSLRGQADEEGVRQLVPEVLGSTQDRAALAVTPHLGGGHCSVQTLRGLMF